MCQITLCRIILSCDVSFYIGCINLCSDVLCYIVMHHFVLWCVIFHLDALIYAVMCNLYHSVSLYILMHHFML